MTRVLIAVHSRVERASLEAALTETSGLEVVASIDVEATALAQAIDREEPDVLLLGMDEGTEEILASIVTGDAGPSVVVLSDDAAGAYGVDLLRMGVRAAVSRSATPSEIVAAVGAAAAGLVALPADAFGLNGRRAVPATERRGLAGPALTAREIEVLRMLVDGLGNKEIAGRLGISDHTVKFHVASIFTKLAVSTRTEAVTAGIRRRLIMI